MIVSVYSLVSSPELPNRFSSCLVLWDLSRLAEIDFDLFPSDTAPYFTRRLDRITNVNKIHGRNPKYASR
jgi:hypothetical protein